MSTELFLAVAIVSFGLTVVGMAMTMQEFRNAEVTDRRC